MAKCKPASYHSLLGPRPSRKLTMWTLIDTTNRNWYKSLKGTSKVLLSYIKGFQLPNISATYIFRRGCVFCFSKKINLIFTRSCPFPPNYDNYDYNSNCSFTIFVIFMILTHRYFRFLCVLFSLTQKTKNSVEFLSFY